MTLPTAPGQPRFKEAKRVLRAYAVMGTVGVIALILGLALGLTRTAPPAAAVALFAAGGGLAPLLAARWRWRRRLLRLERQADTDPGRLRDLTSAWAKWQSFRRWLAAALVYGLLLAAAVIALAVVLLRS